MTAHFPGINTILHQIVDKYDNLVISY